MSQPPLDRNEPPQWGLASDLASGENPSRPTAGQQPRRPFRIGRSASVKPDSESTYGAQPPPTRSQGGQSNDPALVPYGLVSELTRGLPTVRPDPYPNPLSAYPPSSAPQQPALVPARAPGAKRALSLGQQPPPYPQVAAGPNHPQALVPAQQQTWGPPSFAGGNVMADQEPDYGIVSELKGNLLTSPPVVHHNDLYDMGDPSMADAAAVMGGGGGGGGGGGAFGLQAEVARRRGAAQLPVSGRFGGSGIAPLRTRKRLAPAGPQADFGLSQELAERQAQDPFSSANRATNQDPFIMAGEKIKFPGMPEPIPDLKAPSDQELVEGGVLLKVPGGQDAPSTATGVNTDGKQYGIAEDLGAEEALRRLREAEGQPISEEEARRQRKKQLEDLLQWEPPGHKYVYNEETGMIHTNEGGEGMHGGRVAKEFIEDGATGHFYRLNQPGIWRRVKGIFVRDRQRGKGEKPMPSGGEEEEESGLNSVLRSTLFHVSNFFSMLGIFIQGLLAGFSLLNFCLVYIFSSGSQSQFLSYYSPIAMFFARVYFTLITLAVIASVSRYCRDEVRRFQPTRLFLRWVDGFQILFYSLAYVFTILCTPLDDQLTYEYNRDNYFYQLTFNSQFQKRINSFRAFNLLRIVFCGLSWLLFCYQHSPAVFEATLDYESKQRKTDDDLRISAPHPDPSMVLANMSPSPSRMRRRTTFSPSPSPH